MDLITKRVSLKDLNPSFAKSIAEKYDVLEENLMFIQKGLTPEDFIFSEGEKSAIDYITTSIVDRDGEIVDPDGAVLDHYKENPVVLWCHDHKQLPVGKCAWIKRSDRGLVAKTMYAVNSNPLAKQIYQYRKDGFPLAKSIGFVPLDYTDSDPKKNNGLKRKYNKWLMLEYSECPVPSNPEAVGLAISKGLIKPDQKKEFISDELIIDGESIVERYLEKSVDKERYMGKEDKKEDEVIEEKKEDPKEVKCDDCGEMFTPEADETKCSSCGKKKPKKKEDEVIEEKAKKIECSECGEFFTPEGEEVVCLGCGGKKKPKKKEDEEIVEEKAKPKKIECEECGEMFTPEGDETVCSACSSGEEEDEEEPKPPKKKEEDDETVKVISSLNDEIEALKDELVSKDFDIEVLEDEVEILKVGRVISGRNINIIKSCISSMDTAMKALGDLLALTDNSITKDMEDPTDKIDNDNMELDEIEIEEEKDIDIDMVVIKEAISESLKQIRLPLINADNIVKEMERKHRGKVC